MSNIQTMMRFILPLIITISSVSKAQTQVQVTNFIPVQLSTNLVVKNSTKHDSAILLTDHVLGNSFYGQEYIGLDKIDPASSGQWSPIDGFKHIISGHVYAYYFREPAAFESDDDLNFEVHPDLNISYLKKYLDARSLSSFTALKAKIEANCKCNTNITCWPTLPSLSVPDVRQLKEMGILKCNGNHFIWDYQKYHDDYLKNWHLIYEIDIHDREHGKFYPYLSYMPVKGLDYLHAYGPFVHDEKDHYFDSHDNLEIHPAEQIWWRNKVNNNNLYHLFFASDNSGRFRRESWQANPLKGQYAIAFQCLKKTQQINYEMSLVNQLNVSYKSTDGKSHFLVIGEDTLVRVNESWINSITGLQSPDIADVSFQDIYIDKKRLDTYHDTLIKGYVVIKSAIGGPGYDYSGNLLLSVLEKKSGIDPRIQSKSGINMNGQITMLTENKDLIKVTLTQIKANGIDDEGTPEELSGYIAVGAFNLNEHALIKPIESEFNPELNSTLWSSLDDHGETELKFARKGEIKIMNVSRLFYAAQISKIKIVADLNEDDESYPDGAENYNSTVSDEEDDRLEKYCRECSAEINVFDIIEGRPLLREFRFASGGTDIVVQLKIERLKH
ncbi:MAG: hypothetical protein IPP93_04250 [Chitinophagaceae bacterium]|nr:hypothetical protein [Chitinophagaceae bacterium]